MEANKNDGPTGAKVGPVTRLGRGLGRLIPTTKPITRTVIGDPTAPPVASATTAAPALAVAIATAEATVATAVTTAAAAPVAPAVTATTPPTRAVSVPIRQTIPPVSATSASANPTLGLSIAEIPLAQIKPNKRQPRTQFDKASLDGLAASIEENGLLQPITVRRVGSGYELIAGERRLRAFQQLGRNTIPGIIQSADDRDSAVRSLVENIQREDLNTMDRAEGMRRLAIEFSITQSEVAKRVGLDRASVANLIRLCDLDPWTAGCVRSGSLSQGHAKSLLAVLDTNVRKQLGQQVVDQSWSVRQLEREVQRLTTAPTTLGRLPKPGQAPSSHIADLERRIGAKIGTRVIIKTGRKKGSGSITLEFYSNEQFEGLMTQLGVPSDDL